MEQPLSVLAAQIPYEEQDTFLRERYKDTLNTLEEILCLELPVANKKNTFYGANLTAFYEYLLLEAPLLNTKDGCRQLFEAVPYETMENFHTVVLKYSEEPRVIFFINSCARIDRFLTLFYNDSSLEQISRVAKNMLPVLSYKKQISCFLDWQEEPSLEIYNKVVLLAQKGNLSLEVIIGENPFLKDCLDEDV